MTTSRQRILTHLKKTRSASAREIARALKLSAPNVRHHLAVLRSDGRVEEATAANRREGRGRPEKAYALSQAALGDNLPALVHALWAAAGSGLDVEAAARFLVDENRFAGQSMNRRLVLLIETLNAMHYQSRWEAGAGGPRVILGRCPYARALAGRPELCEIDGALLKLALGREVLRIQKPDAGARGVCPFAFQVAV